MDYVLASIAPIHHPKPEDPPNLGPPAFLYRKFRTGNETWEILPRLVAEWTIAVIPDREPNVARAKLCLSIPKDVDEETRGRMQTAFSLWLAEKGE